FSMYHPVLHQVVNPIIVLTQEEMDTGVDSVFGRFGRDGGPHRGEMYSEWLMDYPAEGKVLWPDLFIFTRYRLQGKPLGQTPYYAIGGHSGPTTMNVLHALRSPFFAPGTYSGQDTALVDIIPTIYQVVGWQAPNSFDGRVLDEILIGQGAN
ncbi:MAG: hypothetical protein ACRDIB_09425, partial [Ardenticatenaceae bacterium]